MGSREAEATDRSSLPCSLDGPQFDPAVTSRALGNYADTVAALLKEKRYVELDCIADSARSSKARFSGGAWKIRSIYMGLAWPRPGHPTEEDWKKHFRQLQDWNDERPNSATARIALAESYIEYAWNARGNGYAESVTDSGWKIFDKRMEKARKILEANRTLAAKCPEWYLNMERIAQAQSWKPEAEDQLAEKAIAFAPEYQNVYRLHAQTLLPKWRGKKGDAERFLEAATDKLGGDAGDAVYFLVTSSCFCFGEELNQFSWPRLQRGFAANERLHGPSLNNSNWFAYLALQVGNDDIIADEAFKRISDKWDPDIWGNEESFKASKAHAAGLAPIQRRERQEDEEARANLKTPEGAAYQRSVLQRLDPIEKRCASASEADASRFAPSILISKEGNLLQARDNPHSSMSNCVARALMAPHKTENSPLPLPPHDRYWMILEINPSVINSAKK
ncbi:MAG: hypothetical protein ACLQLC_05085 [Candidatus Sulfotelmatobacter sp.]